MISITNPQTNIGVLVGFNFPGYEPSACIINNGNIIAFAEEERFSREKHAVDRLPIKALENCLRKTRIDCSLIKHICIGWNSPKFSNGFMKNFFETDINKTYGYDSEQVYWQTTQLNNYSCESMYRSLAQILSYFHVKDYDVHFVPHHLSHAASAFYMSGFKESLILTADGSGDENCTVIWLANQQEIIPLFQINLPHSLGWYYSMFTDYLGFIPGDGEWKLMGLAAYGHKNKTLSNKLESVLPLSDDGSYTLVPSYTFSGAHNFSSQYTDLLVNHIGILPRNHLKDFAQEHKDLAYSVQKHLEEAILNCLKVWVKRVKVKKLCLAGGVAYNCKANQAVRESRLFDEVFIQPLAGDIGISIGSAAIILKKLTYRSIIPSKRLDLGPSWADKDILKIITDCNLSAEFQHDIATKTAMALSEGKVVGWFQGSMEAGPRALGYRSILAEPSSINTKNLVNRVVKSRENWRPFCPSILEEYASDYLENPCAAPFMNLTFNVIESVRSSIGAVVHEDGTTRPQIVSKSQNPLFWRLIYNFKILTGIPLVLNTSFNIKDEPIVCSPLDAIRCFYASGLNALAIGSYWIEKKTQVHNMHLKQLITHKNLSNKYDKMILIPAGEFVAGSNKNSLIEFSEMLINLPAFYIDKYPVTNAQYSVFLDYMNKNKDHSFCHKLEPTSKNHTPQYWNDPLFNKPNFPVVGVDWWDAYAFASWANKRLPTEMEWEKAARGANGNIYPWGNKWDENSCNHFKRGIQGTLSTTKVDKYPKNCSPYGVIDMVGNVWQWTSNKFNQHLAECLPWNGEGYVAIRGGSFRRTWEYQHCSFRDDSDPDTRGPNNGFRCVRDSKQL